MTNISIRQRLRARFARIRRVLTRENVARFTYVTLKWGDDHVPFGLRSVLGVVFVIGGVLGILPLVGFWMLPLGAALIALDFPWTRHKVHDWMAHLKSVAESSPTDNQSPGTRNR